MIIRIGDDMCTPASRRTERIGAEPLRVARQRAAAVIASGGLAALPTETVYGLCADARSQRAVAALFAAKGRPAANPLIVHVESIEVARAIARMTPAGEALGAAFWPGPLTLVLPLREETPIAPAVCAGGPTVAVRVPQAPLLRAVSADAGPIVAPSANRSGRVSATTAEAVADELSGRIDLIVDAGPSPIGVESTVVDVSGPLRILRPGAVSADEVAAITGPLAGQGLQEGPLRSPGLLSSHYAPQARLRLDVPATDVRPDEAWLALGAEDSAAPSMRTFRLSPGGDLHEAARRLYAGLRALDATGAGVIAVSPIPDEGIGAAIRDRLARAAAPRPEPAKAAS